MVVTKSSGILGVVSNVLGYEKVDVRREEETMKYVLAPSFCSISIICDPFRSHRGLHIPKQWSQDRYALHDDGADDLGRVPDVGHGVSPKVQFVLFVPVEFPAGADS
jgi:hypothetical protein